MEIDYVTWKIIPKLDYLNKEGIINYNSLNSEVWFVSYIDGWISS